MLTEKVISILKFSLQDAFEGKGEELEALTCVKLVLELHPVDKMDAQFKTIQQETFQTSTPSDTLSTSGWGKLNGAVSQGPRTTFLSTPTCTHSSLHQTPEPLCFKKLIRIYF